MWNTGKKVGERVEGFIADVFVRNERGGNKKNPRRRRRGGRRLHSAGYLHPTHPQMFLPISLRPVLTTLVCISTIFVSMICTL